MCFVQHIEAQDLQHSKDGMAVDGCGRLASLPRGCGGADAIGRVHCGN